MAFNYYSLEGCRSSRAETTILLKSWLCAGAAAAVLWLTVSSSGVSQNTSISTSSFKGPLLGQGRLVHTSSAHLGGSHLRENALKEDRWSIATQKASDNKRGTLSTWTVSHNFSALLLIPLAAALPFLIQWLTSHFKKLPLEQSWTACALSATEVSDWPDAATAAQMDSSPSVDPALSPSSTSNKSTNSPSSEVKSTAVEPLKAQLYARCATSSRGFGATRSDREGIQSIIDNIIATGAGVKEPTQGLMRSALYPGTLAPDGPLLGTWQLLYTTASDVLSLEGNPLIQVQSIYQIFRANGFITNIIDLGPRTASIIRNPLGDSVLRQMVGTRGAARSPTRVGLSFESITSKPVSLLGQDVSNLPPLSFDLPKLGDIFNIGADSTTLDGASYFDILYLDNDLLVVTQSQPGGMFVLTKRPDLDGKL